MNTQDKKLVIVLTYKCLLVGSVVYILIIIVIITEFPVSTGICAVCASTGISTRHGILSAGAPASSAMIFSALTADELQQCLWSRLLVHPVDGKMTIFQDPAMTIWAGRRHSRFQTLVPNACLMVGSVDMILQSIFGLWQVACLSILAAEQFVPNNVCAPRVCRRNEHIPSAALHPCQMSCQPSSWHCTSLGQTQQLECLLLAFAHKSTCPVTSGEGMHSWQGFAHIFT